MSPLALVGAFDLLGEAQKMLDESTLVLND